MSVIYDTFKGGRALSDRDTKRFCARIKESANGCWIWNLKGRECLFTFKVNGAKKVRCVARLAWEQSNGLVRIKNRQVVRSCGERRCVRPEHLRLISRREISLATCRFGTEHPYARITDDDVRDIRAAFSEGESVRSIGKRYGMSGANAHLIATRKTWARVSDVGGEEVRP